MCSVWQLSVLATGLMHSDPDETRTPPKTLIELVNVAGGQIGRYTFQPGWRWVAVIQTIRSR